MQRIGSIADPPAKGLRLTAGSTGGVFSPHRRGIEWEPGESRPCATCGEPVSGTAVASATRLREFVPDEARPGRTLHKEIPRRWFHVRCVTMAEWSEWLGPPVSATSTSRTGPGPGTKAWLKSITHAARGGATVALTAEILAGYSAADLAPLRACPTFTEIRGSE